MNLEEPLNSPKYDIADQHVKKLHNGYELDVKRSSSGHVFTNFPSTNQRVFSTKYNVILFILICWSARKWEKMPCLNNKEFVVVFQLRNIGEKIRKFVLGKFVKTCHELNNRERKSCQYKNFAPMSNAQTNPSRTFEPNCSFKFV